MDKVEVFLFQASLVPSGQRETSDDPSCPTGGFTQANPERTFQQVELEAERVLSILAVLRGQ